MRRERPTEEPGPEQREVVVILRLVDGQERDRREIRTRGAWQALTARAGNLCRRWGRA
jgi:hypothetical protein